MAGRLRNDGAMTARFRSLVNQTLLKNKQFKNLGR
jgi:hypothetical protein